MTENKEANFIKQICKDLNLTYAQLAEKIGYSEGAIKTAVSKNKISEPLAKAIELYLEVLELKEKVKIADDFKENLRNFLNK